MIYHSILIMGFLKVARIAVSFFIFIILCCGPSRNKKNSEVTIKSMINRLSKVRVCQNN